MLTEREIEVIRLMAEGLSNKMMVPKTGFQEGSIETVKCRVYKKLKVKNGCECVAVAIRRGIIQ